MGDIFDSVVGWFSGAQALNLLKGVVILALGLLLARLVARAVGRIAQQRLSPQHGMIMMRVIRYGITVVVVIVALRHVGFDLSLLVGAAGILTLALGFASQTSASNVISGFFLMGEQPFVIGDVIMVGTTTGEVLSIDLLSVKLRTFDNLLVRIPNESLLKMEITNLTHFPIRRMDLTFGVSLREDLSGVKEALAEVAGRNPLVLDEPGPLFVVLGYGESSINIQWSLWVTKERFVEVKREIYMDLKQALDAAGILLPFPHRVVVNALSADVSPGRSRPSHP